MVRKLELIILLLNVDYKDKIYSELYLEHSDDYFFKHKKLDDNILISFIKDNSEIIYYNNYKNQNEDIYSIINLNDITSMTNTLIANKGGI